MKKTKKVTILSAATFLAASSFAITAQIATAAPPGCVEVNSGTPFCYMMCDNPPRLRTCDAE